MPLSKKLDIYLFLILLLIGCISGNLLAESSSFICIKKFSVNFDTSSSSIYQNLDQYLYKRLILEPLPYGIRPVLLESGQQHSCIAVVSGSIDIENRIPTLQFVLSDSKTDGEEIKNIPITELEIEQILDIMTLKIRYFLEQNISGILRISSTPLGCSVLLNGITVGTTPAELTLEKGTYVLKLQHDYLYTFTDTVKINSGNHISVQPVMSFEGHRLKPWIFSAAILTVSTAACWIIENSLHKSYSNLEEGLDQSVYDKSYNKYRPANYLRIGLLNASALCWTVNGFLIVRNNSLKKKIFGK